MNQVFNPPVGAQNAGLRFAARSVIVDSGPNYVTIYPDGVTIPPLVKGQLIPLDPPELIARWLIAAPPAPVAQGGVSAITQLTYSDAPAAFQTGVSLGALAAEQTGIIYGSQAFANIAPGGVQTRNLSFPARSVLVDTGANVVNFPDLGRTLPMWTYHAIVHIPTPTAAPRDQTIASSANNPNVGPAILQQTNLQYLEQAFAPSPGVPAPFQQQGDVLVNLLAGDGGVGQLVTRGLARWLSITITNGNGTGANWDIYAFLNGSYQKVYSAFPIAGSPTQGYIATFWAGQAVGPTTASSATSLAAYNPLPLADSYQILCNTRTTQPYSIETRALY